MTDIARYDLVHTTYIGDAMERRDDGEWVQFDDVVELLRQLKIAREAAATYRNAYEEYRADREPDAVAHILLEWEK